MQLIRRLTLIVPLIIFVLSSMAQEKTVSGTVLSEKDGEPIANATVTNRNTKKIQQQHRQDALPSKLQKVMCWKLLQSVI